MTTTPEFSRITDTINDAEVLAFDWDGTLIDMVPYKLAQNQALAREFGNDLTLEEVRGIWVNAAGFQDHMQKLCLTDDMDAIMAVVRRDYSRPEYAKRAFPFTEEVLQTIRSMGKRAALITSLTRELVNADAQTLGLEPVEAYFDYTQTADEAPYKKPNPLVFAGMFNALNVDPSRVAYVGDEMNDFIAANEAGIPFIGVENGMTSVSEFRTVGALSVASIADLPLKTQ